MRLPEKGRTAGYTLLVPGQRNGVSLRRRPVIILIGLFLFSLLLYSTDSHQVPQRWRDPCHAWDPHADEQFDNPECFRAQQFRQVSRFTNLPQYEGLREAEQQMVIKRVARCALGITKCPERPLIVVDWMFVYNYMHDTGVRHGEEVWIEPIMEGIKEMGYELLVFNRGEENNWNITRLLDKSIHMYITDANQAFRCFHNPYCVRPEDYVKPSNESLVVHVPPEREAERGTLPAWRIFGLSFWGARPNRFNAVYLDTARHWGINGNDGLEEWSHHVLGNKWTITPFKYPGHTDIPLTIEQSCLLSRKVPQEERDDGVLVLAKAPVYFYNHDIQGIHPEWPRVVEAMKEIGIDLWTTSMDAGKPPEGVIQLGIQKPKAYTRVMSRARAMLGIGMPSISPSPYEALCAGVPVLFPRSGNHSLSGWDMYQPHWFQHGPLQAIGEPYVYSYDSSSPDDLIDKLKLAVSTPIEPFIPPEMTTNAVFGRVRELLAHDWEKEYHAVRAVNGGRNPGYKDGMYDKCFARGVCDPKVLLEKP